MRRRTQQRWVVAVAIGTLVALTLALVTASIGGDGASVASSSTSTTATTVPLNDAGRELLALLEKDKNATFHARYTATSAEQPNAAIVVETWRKPPRVRQDTAVTSGGQRLTSIALLLEGTSIRCAQLGEAPWSCQRQAVDESAGDLLFGGVREQLGKGPVTVRDDVIDGTRVRCFTLEAEGKKSELCAREDGIPVRVQSSTGASLRLIGFDAAVNDEVFVPPAEPSPAS